MAVKEPRGKKKTPLIRYLSQDLIQFVLNTTGPAGPAQPPKPLFLPSRAPQGAEKKIFLSLLIYFHLGLTGAEEGRQHVALGESYILEGWEWNFNVGNVNNPPHLCTGRTSLLNLARKKNMTRRCYNLQVWDSWEEKTFRMHSKRLLIRLTMVHLQ